MKQDRGNISLDRWDESHVEISSKKGKPSTFRSKFSKGKMKHEKSDEKLPPVTFLTLFRYSTALDKFMIVCGLVAAAVQGTAMPILVLLFGRMTDLFVEFIACMQLDGDESSGESNSSLAPACNLSGNFSEIESKGYQALGSVMTTFALFYVYVACVVVVSGFLQVYTFVHSATRQTKRIRQAFFRAVMRQELEWIESREAGELNTRLNEEVIKIRDAIGEKMAFFMNSVAAVVSGIAVGFANGWELTLIVLATTPVLAVVVGLMAKFISSWNEKETRAYSKAGAIVENVLRNIRTVIAYGAQDQEVERYNVNLGEAEKQGVRKGILLGTMQGLIWCCMMLTFSLSFWYGSTLALDSGSTFTIGNLMTVFFAMMMSSFHVGFAVAGLETFFSGRVAAAAIFQIIDRNSRIDPLSDDGVILKDVSGNINFKNVGFRYPSRMNHHVLSSFNEEFSAGKIFALTGPSGTGKSTLLKLIQRLYDPSEGKITLDGEDITNLNVRWLRRLIGVVQQEPALFATTISDNIKLGSEITTEDDVINAAKAANAYDFIMELPEKFETLVGVGGCQLSGGQKQRIAIARALVRNPKILLLDQGCSALDTHSQAIVLDNLSKAKKYRTTILVAHRESALQGADHVIHMECDKEVLDETADSADVAIVESNEKISFINETFCAEELKNLQNGLRKSPERDITTCRITRPADTLQTNLSLTNCQNGRSPTDSDAKSVEEGELDDEDPPPGTSLRVIRMNMTEWPYIIVGSLAALLNGGVQPTFGVLLAAIIGVYAAQLSDYDKQITIDRYCLLLVALAAVSFFAYFLQHSMFAKSGELLTRRIRKMTFAAILRQDMAWFDRHATGSSSLSSRLANDAGLIKGTAGIQIGYAVTVGSTIILALVIAFFSGWKLAFLQIAFFPLLIGSYAVQARMLNANNLRDQKTLEVAGRLVVETLATFETVLQLGKEEYFANKFQDILKTLSRNGRKAAVIQGVIFGFASSVLYFSYAATFRFGAELIINMELSFENMFRVYFVIVLTGISLGRSNRHMPDFGEAKKAASRTFKILDRIPPIDVNSSEGISPDVMNGDLQLKSCDFTYATRLNCRVLENLNIGIESGKTLALVGKSGCGKSTIVQLIERFYDPEKGTVLIDGKDVRDYNLKYLRSKVGVVFQDPALFDGTVYENIIYGDAGRIPTREEVYEAATTANIHEFISGLDEGYDTQVGNAGSHFSRGQKQRIAIARALVRNPSILLLDEATSSLDTENEKIVQEALDRAREGRTSVMIAHRLSTIRNADKIVVMSKRKILESGTHASLMQSQGAYFELVNAGITLS